MPEYPDAICQFCGEISTTTEEVNVSHIGKVLELWVYCESCMLETFHPIPKEHQ